LCWGPMPFSGCDEVERYGEVQRVHREHREETKNREKKLSAFLSLFFVPSLCPL
jgi:hypothetical protein